MLFRPIKNPMTRKRLARFKEIKQAHISLWILTALYLVSLFSECICNDIPIYVRYNGRSYFPILRFYTEDQFTGSGRRTRPDYKTICDTDAFRQNPTNMMIFPPIPYGPYQSIDPSSISVSKNVNLVFTAMPRIGAVDIAQDFTVLRSMHFGPFIKKTDAQAQGTVLTDYFVFPKLFKEAVARRFENQQSPRIVAAVEGTDGSEVQVALSGFFPRKRPPKTVRLTFRESVPKGAAADAPTVLFIKDGHLPYRSSQKPEAEEFWNKVPVELRERLLELVEMRFLGPVESIEATVEGRKYRVDIAKKDVLFPFPPVAGHVMGIDAAGRDVFARILYGLRTSMTFGFLLVLSSMGLGILCGSIQGYYGGMIDISGQRFIEIWSALPFLYIMILMGSIYGRSFSLLLFCYGIFNWIGISYYVRAEFLRLRNLPFIEAARCMGISSLGIIFRHILPNALVPVITFFPFSLVGAIGALAALDYLGFGLPPPTPSWGELLFQAQQFRWAWWLILYPSSALFIVMLLGVFVGEGVRNAYDPKRFARIE